MIFDGLSRQGWWPGPPPDISPDRKMCSACVYSSAAIAGWQWDRCHHPKADNGGVVRDDETPRCADMRNSNRQCGLSAVWFVKRPKGANVHCYRCGADAAALIKRYAAPEGSMPTVWVKHITNIVERFHCHVCGGDFETRGCELILGPLDQSGAVISKDE